ncbi:MAG TPA: MarR family transcriptional regulator [Candidatus Saccharimonadales bacterium]|nr:MarR family transcriptional regulator [Candidatus Saccharimonadales bacterium]
MVEDVKYFMETLVAQPTLESFVGLLFRFLLCNKQQIVSIGHEHGLTSMQTISLLLMGEDTKSRSMSSLCTLFSCDPSNITGIVDGLEHKGLIAREEKPGDRRVKMIRLLPAGEIVRRDILQKLSSQSGYLLTSLSPSEMTELSKLMQKLTANCPFLHTA